MSRSRALFQLNVVWSLVISLISGCSGLPTSPTAQVIQPEETLPQIVAMTDTPTTTPTSTPLPTSTSRPSPIPSMTPIPTAGPDFITKAGQVCDQSQSNKMTRGEPPKAVFSILKMRDKWYRNSYLIPFAEVNLADQVKTLVCIDETYTKVGTYDDGNPAYRVNQDVSLVNFSTGEVYRQKSFHGGNPPQLKLSAIPAGYGDNPDQTIILQWVMDQLEISYFTHDSSVTSVEFSPDGTHLAVNSFQNEVKVWNLQNKKAITLVNGQDSYGSNAKVSYSTDGATLAYLDSEYIKFKNFIGNLKVPSTDGTRLSNEYLMDFAPNGNEIAIGGIVYDGNTPDGVVIIFDLPTGSIRQKMVRTRLDGQKEAGYKFTDLIYSPDGKYIATQGPGLAEVFSTEDGRSVFFVQIELKVPEQSSQYQSSSCFFFR